MTLQDDFGWTDFGFFKVPGLPHHTLPLSEGELEGVFPDIAA
jgi:hypothetical protein